MYHCGITDKQLEKYLNYRNLIKSIECNDFKQFKKLFYSEHFTKENLVPDSYSTYKSCLMYACENCNVKIVKCILKSNKCSKKLIEYSTPSKNVLHYVCLTGNLSILKLIISSRLCDKHIVNSYKFHDEFLNEVSPLMILMLKNYNECAKYLINSKKCVFDDDRLFEAYLSNTSIFEYILNSKLITSDTMNYFQNHVFSRENFSSKFTVNIKSFEVYLNSEYVTEDILIAKPKYMKLFGKSGNDEMAMKFIESNKFTRNILTKLNKFGEGCLHLSFAYRSIDVILKILDNPIVDYSVINQLNQDGETPLDYLCMIDRSIDDINQILMHPNVKPYVQNLLLPKMYYICRVCPEIFIYLITFEGVTRDMLKNSREDGWTCLTICATHYSSKILDLLNMDIFDEDYVAIQTEPDNKSEFVSFDNMQTNMKKGGQTFLHILAYKNPKLFCQIISHEKVQHILHIKDNSDYTCFDFLIVANNNGYGKCKICYTCDDFVSLNCGHICCSKCAESLTVCHLCREPVTEFNRVYL